jgi:hypothetical protein
MKLFLWIWVLFKKGALHFKGRLCFHFHEKERVPIPRIRYIFDGAIYFTKHTSSSLAATDNTNRRGRVKNIGKVACKGFCNKLQLHKNFISNFNLGNRLIIPFRFRNISPKVLCLGPQIIINLPALKVVLTSL